MKDKKYKANCFLVKLCLTVIIIKTKVIVLWSVENFNG